MDLDRVSYERLITSSARESNHSESHGENSTSIIMPMNSHSCRSSLNDKKDTMEKPNPAKRKKSRKTRLDKELAEVSRRLTKRKQLQIKCSRINDLMCILALSGVALMILANELSFASLDHHETNLTWFIKLIITLSTMILILLVIYYHYVDMLLYSVNNSLQYWYVALTRSRMIQIIMEILICAIHPFPRGVLNRYEVISRLNDIKLTMSASGIISLSFIPLDVALGLPMFARLYLLCRTITFHSRFLRDSSSRSIGYLNKVSINFSFIMKVSLEQSPGFCLGAVCFVIVFIGSWSFRACNYTSTYEHLPILNSMWLFFTLFTTVGYGDLIPTTYCGRGVATLTALTGVTVSAFLIAVISQKLLLSRWEKYIYTFVLNIELAKEQRCAAANIIKYAWKMWRLKNHGRGRSLEYINTEKTFFGLISVVRQIKQTRLQLSDNVLGLPEMMIIQRDTNARSVEIETKTTSNESRIDQLEKILQDIKDGIHAMDNRLNLLLEKSS